MNIFITIDIPQSPELYILSLSVPLCTFVLLHHLSQSEGLSRTASWLNHHQFNDLCKSERRRSKPTLRDKQNKLFSQAPCNLECYEF